ncbi:hypothetical protein QBC37DRAFT_404680 [Rhypophila decipiens]|uniref:Uncharacterized protein n=1 Tax=Rhypophila decipiens TaxID=261697 RepID=A0AAN7B322_9PEZI|nr:hypothetical protein QBC37DRAFT_404680 [Rhypophila decipiens]
MLQIDVTSDDFLSNDDEPASSPNPGSPTSRPGAQGRAAEGKASKDKGKKAVSTTSTKSGSTGIKSKTYKPNFTKSAAATSPGLTSSTLPPLLPLRARKVIVMERRDLERRDPPERLLRLMSLLPRKHLSSRGCQPPVTLNGPDLVKRDLDWWIATENESLGYTRTEQEQATANDLVNDVSDAKKKAASGAPTSGNTFIYEQFAIRFETRVSIKVRIATSSNQGQCAKCDNKQAFMLFPSSFNPPRREESASAPAFNSPQPPPPEPPQVA